MDIWSVGMIEGPDITAYFPVQLNDPDLINLAGKEKYLSKVYEELSECIGDERAKRFVYNSSIFPYEDTFSDPDDPLEWEKEIPHFPTKEKAEDYINERFDVKNGVAIGFAIE